MDYISLRTSMTRLMEVEMTIEKSYSKVNRIQCKRLQTYKLCAIKVIKLV